MNADARLFLTPDEAIALLHEEYDYVHNIVGGGGLVLGCDYSRKGAEDAFREARSIEIAGDTAKALKHPLCVIDANGRQSFFEADDEKVAAFEASLAAKGKT